MKSKVPEKNDTKTYFNQNQHPGLLSAGNERQRFIIMMKQLEEIERVERAQLEVLVELVPEKKQKSLMYKIKDILDDGELNNSVE